MALSRAPRYPFRRNSKVSPPRYYGLDKLDERLLPYVRRRRGTFVELGAFDGLDQSNTAWLEANRGWRGVLVEAIPDTYDQCRRNRPLADVANCACVALDYPQATVEMIYSGLMSIVRGARSSEEADDEWVALGEQLQEITRYDCIVPARTLTSVLDEYGLRYIDLLSLDVEGYELEVMQGLDLDRFRPRHILVEESGRGVLEAYITARGYRPAAEIGRGEKTRDVLYERALGARSLTESLWRIRCRWRYFAASSVRRRFRALRDGGTS